MNCFQSLGFDKVKVNRLIALSIEERAQNVRFKNKQSSLIWHSKHFHTCTKFTVPTTMANAKRQHTRQSHVFWSNAYSFEYVVLT